jgi:hypothetical protein
MCDPWAELDTIIRHQGNYVEIEREKTEILHWRTRAERAEQEVLVWKEKTRKLAEAVREERDLHEASYNELFEERNTLEEKCSLLEEKMLKLIETVKTQRSKNMTGSQIAREAAIPNTNNSNAELLREMEQRLKQANQESENRKVELAESRERAALLEAKLRQIAEALKVERESNQKATIESQKVEIDLLKSKLVEFAKREQALQERLKERLNDSGANAQTAEARLREMEDKLQRIAQGVRKEREQKAKELNDLKQEKEKLDKLLDLHQTKLKAMETELYETRSSKIAQSSQEEAMLWKLKAEEAIERANRTEIDSTERIETYKNKVKQILMQQDAKMKQLGFSASATPTAAPTAAVGALQQRLHEATQQCHLLEQRNRELENELAARPYADLPLLTTAGLPPAIPADAPPPPPAAAPPPPPPPQVQAVGGASSSLADALKNKALKKTTPTAPKPSTAPAGPNLAQMAAELANQRRQRMLNNTANKGFRKSVRLDIILADINS